MISGFPRKTQRNITRAVCKICFGRGRVSDEPCKHCAGAGYYRDLVAELPHTEQVRLNGYFARAKERVAN